MSTSDPNQLDASAAAIEEEANKIERIDIGDEKLLSFWSEYVSLYRAMSKVVRDAAELARDLRRPASRCHACDGGATVPGGLRDVIVLVP